MDRYEEFQKGTGTYLKVVRFAEWTNPDAFLVLYLRPRGRFLFVGYWPGYERSVAAGKWRREEAEVMLEGRGWRQTDVLPGPPGGRFERRLTHEDLHFTPSLVATDELKGWSLLSWTGSYVYVGQYTIIDPDGQWMPESVRDVDAWIDRLMQA